MKLLVFYSFYELFLFVKRVIFVKTCGDDEGGVM